MLNEVPNNNDVKHVANNVFNEAPNSNDMITRKVRVDGNKLCPEKEWRLYTQ